MKRKIGSLLVAICTAIMSASAQTGDPVTQPEVAAMPTSVSMSDFPVTEKMLDAYAFGLVKKVPINMYPASSGVGGGFYTNLTYSGRIADPVALAALPNSVKPRVTLANPAQDVINYNLSYNMEVEDQSGGKSEYNLFYGNDTKKPIPAGNEWELPEFNVPLTRTDWVPWHKKGLDNAYMVFRDKSGRVVDNYSFDQDGRIDRRNGFLFLGKQHMHRLGEVYVSTRDEQGNYHTEVVNLKDGVSINPTELPSSGASVSFAGFITLPPNAPFILHKAVEGAPGLYYAEYTEPTLVSVKFVSPTGVAVSIYAIEAEDLRDNPENWEEIKPGDYTIGSGHRLFFRFESGNPNLTPIHRPEYGGGSGGGKGVVEPTEVVPPSPKG